MGFREVHGPQILVRYVRSCQGPHSTLYGQSILSWGWLPTGQIQYFSHCKFALPALYPWLTIRPSGGWPGFGHPSEEPLKSLKIPY
jgi:hypothetical protein